MIASLNKHKINKYIISVSQWVTAGLSWLPVTLNLGSRGSDWRIVQSFVFEWRHSGHYRYAREKQKKKKIGMVCVWRHTRGVFKVMTKRVDYRVAWILLYLSHGGASYYKEINKCLWNKLKKFTIGEGYKIWETALNVRRTSLEWYRDVDKSLARPGRKQATATEDFDVHISYL
jgi:hypothetical protein